LRRGGHFDVLSAVRLERGPMGAAAILKLQAAGFTAEQVTAIADLIDTQFATKADLEGVEHRLTSIVEATEHRLDLKIEALEHRLDLTIEALEHRLEAKIEAVDRRLDLKITTLQGEMVLLKWMMGFVLAFQVAIFAKLFLH
jgi:hypothetical protein